MLNRFALDASRRRRLRRVALYAFLGFCVLSAIIHFTVGSLVAMLFPGEKLPAAQPSQVISILTITHLEKQQLPTTTPIEQRKIAMRDVTHPDPVKEHQVTQKPSATNASASSLTISTLIAPSQRSASAGGSGQRASASQTAGAGSQSGASVAAAKAAAGSGASANQAGEDESYPGRQMPSGAVFSASGPAGQSGSSSGNSILMSGGNGTLAPDHDSCAPPRGEFF